MVLDGSGAYLKIREHFSKRHNDVIEQKNILTKTEDFVLILGVVLDGSGAYLKVREHFSKRHNDGIEQKNGF